MNETAKKILGFIKRLPETWDGQPLRQQALDNFDEKFACNCSCKDEYDTIGGAFYWRDSKEGHDYWSKINELLFNGTIQLLPVGEEKKDEFVWTDELVAEFTSWSLTKSPTMQGRYADIEQFKASKQRKPLFTTEDGKQIFKGDVYWFVVINNNFDITSTIACGSERQIDQCKDFSTEAAAREYVRLNKPMYSLNDVKKTWVEITGVFNLEVFIKELEKLKA